MFCDVAKLRLADVYIESAFCVYPRDPPDVLRGSGVIVPIAHRASPFDFMPEELVATGELLVQENRRPDPFRRGSGRASLFGTIVRD